MEYLTFDQIEIGRDLLPVEHLVTAEEVAMFREASMDESTPPDVAPLMLAASYVRRVYESMPSPPGGIHAKQQYTFHAPVRVGDRLTTSGTVGDKYVKRERNYVIVDSLTHNQDGVLVTTARATRIWAR